MKVRLFRQRTVWCPTWLGWLCLLPLLGALPVWWFFSGEAFLSLTTPEAADVLVVEGWIGRGGIGAAKDEFERGDYRWLIATGGYTGKGGWAEEQWSYAKMAGQELLRLGVPGDSVILASSGEAESERTYQSAVATRAALAARGIEPTAVNVLTRGPHSRRSRLVFAKALGPRLRVGVISWQPPEDRHMRWWQSSERAKELLTETAAYWFEVLAGSGRWMRRPPGGAVAAVSDPTPAGTATSAGTPHSR